MQRATIDIENIRKSAVLYLEFAISVMNSYNTEDTIIALSSGSTGAMKIIRISGMRTFEILSKWVGKLDVSDKIVVAEIKIDNQLSLPCKILTFKSPKSYTGDDIAEIHLYCADCITQTIIANFLSIGARLANAGEFTARAYLNGKISLEQAEAVAEIIQSSNKEKLVAAQKLFGGRLKEKIKNINEKIIELLSLLEAGLDFSQEDMEFISQPSALEKTENIIYALNDILSSNIAYEEFLDLPCIGIAGAANAGKSSLINAILGWQRSIVSATEGTTRDVLKEKAELANSHCIIFDCAGFLGQQKDIIDELAFESTVAEIKTAHLILFCIDSSKKDYRQDAAILGLVKKVSSCHIIAVITKADTVDSEELIEKAGMFSNIISDNLIITSSKTKLGINDLKNKIDNLLQHQKYDESQSEKVTINHRHRQNIISAIENTQNCILELKKASYETASMFLRQAYQCLSDIENEYIDEKILEKIFSSFCIGK